MLQTLAQGLQEGEQLGLSLRPAATRRDLRALSEGALDALAELEPNAELVLVAHGDTVAQAQADAQQALIALAEARGDRPSLAIDVIAMGPALPIACREDRWAAEMNRRIDLWQRPPRDSPRIEN